MLPPFGKVLINRFVTNDVYLFVGTNAWKKAKSFQYSRPGTLCLPAYTSAFVYEWPVANCDILMIDTGFCEQSYIEETASCLFSYQANIVRYISPEGLLTVYKKEF